MSRYAFSVNVPEDQAAQAEKTLLRSDDALYSVMSASRGRPPELAEIHVSLFTSTHNLIAE